MSQFIPLVLEEEKKRLKAVVNQGPIGIIFDGTTRLGEAIVIVVRFLDGWVIRQRLVRLHTVAKAVTGQDLTRFINPCLANEYQINGDMVVAAMRDGAATNGVAVRNLKVLYPNLFDVTCFSHTANNAGRRFEFPALDEFGHLWVQLFSHSHKAKLMWKQRTDTSVKSFSQTRWWSLWEVYHQLFLYFGDVQPFLEQLNDVSPRTVAQLLAILTSEDDCTTLRLELAAIIDVGQHLVTLTYNLEGDGPLVFSTHELLQKAATAFSQANWSNLKSLCRSMEENDATINARRVEQEVMEGAKGAINWFLHKFNVELGDTVMAFRLARFFDPVLAQSLSLTPEKVNALRAFPFLDKDDIIQGLTDELPQYLAAIDGVELQSDDEKVHWWQRQRNIPQWSDAVRKLLLVQPSSAASERAFSLLATCFSDQQDSALEDYVEASVMLRYNRDVNG